ncbi:MAG TPA: DAK2 domain-containing protein, partial [Candidatus Binatia bacterium]|nr:DAK2 domain-containing protein [Candidatus Binatia bacterium]
QAIKRGSLYGARGNSGVIASQIFGGMADGLGTKRRFNGLDLAFALRTGAERAYQAVTEPVEGTILTVIREAADAAVAAAERDPDIDAVLAATVDAADRSVARTPTLLPILREAGVVDSGGQGLYRLLQGALLQVVGKAPAATTRETGPARLSLLVAHADEGHGYETVYFVRPNGHGRLDLDAMRERLNAIGESVIVAGDGSEAKIHVHNERPDEVIAYGLALGDLSDITVVNLDHQTRDVRDRRVGELTGTTAEQVSSGSTVATMASPSASDLDGAADRPTPPAMWIDPRARDGAVLPLAVVAVAAGDGLVAEFKARGASAVVTGGQSANPSTGELLAAVDRINAAEIVILPNNRNVVLAASQVAALATRPVHVVPTRNAIEGLEAILAVAPGLDVAANVTRMTEQGRAVRTLQVTRAVRDARVSGKRVKKDQMIVLDPDEGLVAAHRDTLKAILAAFATFSAGFEAVNVLYGEGADLAEAEALAARLGEAHPGVEVDVGRGGQPLYPYLIAVW